MKQYRMSIQSLNEVYLFRKTGHTASEVNRDDMAATDELIDGETFGAYYDRMKERLDLFDENEPEDEDMVDYAHKVCGIKAL